MAEQSFKNHTKFVPMFHVVILGILGINLIHRIIRIAHEFDVNRLIELLLAVAFILMALYGRLFALTVQDRVIRLEMRLRLTQLLSPDLRARIPQFTVGQLVSLRFASDAELPELARKVLDENIQDRRAIKKMIRDWQADWLRA